MYSNGQWSGNGQPDMADSLREWVEMMPERPIERLARFVIRGFYRILGVVKQPLPQDQTMTHCGTPEQHSLG